jgi:hypothetical protein
MKTESRVRARPSSLLFPNTWVLSWDRGDRRSDEAINKKRTTALGTPGKGSCSHRRDGGEPVSRPRRRRPRVVHLRTATSFQETYCIKQEVEKLHPRRPRASRAPSSSQSPVRPSHVVGAFCGMVPVLRAITAQRTCSCILACVRKLCWWKFESDYTWFNLKPIRTWVGRDAESESVQCMTLYEIFFYIIAGCASPFPAPQLREERNLS